MRILKNIYHNIVHLGDEYRQKTATEEYRSDLLELPEFFSFVILASILTTVALLDGNEAVIIGAMIITPFIGSFVGIGLASIMHDWKLLQKSLIRCLGGVFVFFIVAYIVSILSPPESINNTIKLRATEIGIRDIIIALSAGAVTALSLGSGSIQSRITGVAVAVSLAPPLAVSAITLSIGEIEMYQNALLLFGLNVGGIISISTLLFLIFGFHKKDGSIKD